MSVLRLRGKEPQRLVELADKILIAWRGYTDAEAFIFAETDGVLHNTITPIARRRGEDYELDLCCATISLPKSILWACIIPMPSCTTSKRRILA